MNQGIHLIGWDDYLFYYARNWQEFDQIKAYRSNMAYSNMFTENFNLPLARISIALWEGILQ